MPSQCPLPERSSDILSDSDCSLALYPPQSTPSSLAYGHHLPCDIPSRIVVLNQHHRGFSPSPPSPTTEGSSHILSDCSVALYRPKSLLYRDETEFRRSRRSKSMKIRYKSWHRLRIHRYWGIKQKYEVVDSGPNQTNRTDLTADSVRAGVFESNRIEPYVSDLRIEPISNFMIRVVIESNRSEPCRIES
jgi:hypothetical protein